MCKIEKVKINMDGLYYNSWFLKDVWLFDTLLKVWN